MAALKEAEAADNLLLLVAMIIHFAYPQVVVFSMYIAWVVMRYTNNNLILAVLAPFTIGPIFKYFLLVPMPTEGMVVAVLDALRYWDF